MGIQEDYKRFCKKLRSSEKLPITSHPSPEGYLRIFQAAQQLGDEVLVLSLSSGQSGAVESAYIAKEMCGYDKITIADPQQAVMPQRIMMEHAVKMRDEGKSMKKS